MLENLKYGFIFSSILIYIRGMIPRFIQPRLLDDLAHVPVSVLLGPRQVGKTTLAQTIRTQIGKESIYLDLELTTDAEVLDNAESYLSSKADKLVIIDEVQRKPALFPLIRALVDQQRQPGRFLLLGSASPTLIRHSAESLAGRVSYSELAPFSLPEIESQIRWRDHWFNGGFPEPLLMANSARVGRWLDDFVSAFVERDLRPLGYQIGTPTLTRLMQMLTTVHGNLLNISELSRSLGLSSPTISGYLDLLEGGFLIHRLPPYFANVSKRLVKSPKLYIRDSGILHRLARIRLASDLPTHILVGASWEGYVIEQLRRTAYETEFYFYRTQAGAECDLFVILPDGRRACIEIKFSDVPKLTRGFYESVKDLAPDFRYILVPQGRTYTTSENVTVCPLPEFLKTVWPIWVK